MLPEIIGTLIVVIIIAAIAAAIIISRIKNKKRGKGGCSCGCGGCSMEEICHTKVNPEDNDASDKNK